MNLLLVCAMGIGGKRACKRIATCARSYNNYVNNVPLHNFNEVLCMPLATYILNSLLWERNLEICLTGLLHCYLVGDMGAKVLALISVKRTRGLEPLLACLHGVCVCACVCACVCDVCKLLVPLQLVDNFISAM